MSLFVPTSATPRLRRLSAAGIVLLATALGVGQAVPAMAETSTLAAQLSSRQRGASISVRLTLSKSGDNTVIKTVKAKGTVRR